VPELPRQSFQGRISTENLGLCTIQDPQFLWGSQSLRRVAVATTILTITPCRVYNKMFVRGFRSTFGRGIPSRPHRYSVCTLLGPPTLSHRWLCLQARTHVTRCPGFRNAYTSKFQTTAKTVHGVVAIRRVTWHTGHEHATSHARSVKCLWIARLLTENAVSPADRRPRYYGEKFIPTPVCRGSWIDFFQPFGTFRLDDGCL